MQYQLFTKENEKKIMCINLVHITQKRQKTLFLQVLKFWWSQLQCYTGLLERGREKVSARVCVCVCVCAEEKRNAS